MILELVDDPGIVETAIRIPGRVERRVDHLTIGGGLAFANGRVFVSSGYRSVSALDAKTGKVIWQVKTDNPIHSAPTSMKFSQIQPIKSKLSKTLADFSRPPGSILSPPGGERTDAKRQERGVKLATVFFKMLWPKRP